MSARTNTIIFLTGMATLDPTLLEAERRFRFRPDGAPNPGSRLQRAHDMFLSIATMDALLDSLTTVALQQQPGAPNLAADGSGTEADFISAAAAAGDPVPETVRRLMRHVLHHQADQLQDDASIVVLEWRTGAGSQLQL